MDKFLVVKTMKTILMGLAMVMCVLIMYITFWIYIPLDRKYQKSTQKSNRAQKRTKKVMKLKNVLKKVSSLKKVMNSKKN